MDEKEDVIDNHIVEDNAERAITHRIEVENDFVPSHTLAHEHEEVGVIQAIGVEAQDTAQKHTPDDHMDNDTVRYKKLPITWGQLANIKADVDNQPADVYALQMFRGGVLGLTSIADVLERLATPTIEAVEIHIDEYVGLGAYNSNTYYYIVSDDNTQLEAVYRGEQLLARRSAGEDTTTQQGFPYTFPIIF